MLLRRLEQRLPFHINLNLHMNITSTWAAPWINIKFNVCLVHVRAIYWNILHLESVTHQMYVSATRQPLTLCNISVTVTEQHRLRGNQWLQTSLDASAGKRASRSISEGSPRQVHKGKIFNILYKVKQMCTTPEMCLLIQVNFCSVSSFADMLPCPNGKKKLLLTFAIPKLPPKEMKVMM